MTKYLKFIVFWLMALLSCPDVFAATYYVDTTNAAASDSNPGTQSQPWKTIQKAASTATAGATIIIKAGEYNEFVTNQVSGTAGNPITFTGERGSNGEWLTIIDPSTPITNGWVAAPEIGSGVWKQTNMSFTTHVVTINNKHVFGTYTMGVIDNSYNAYTVYTKGTDFLTLPSNAVVTISSSFGGGTVTWWDSVGAFFCSTGNVCYLRLRDGSDPNGLNIRCGRNDASRFSDLGNPAIKIQGYSYIVWSNVLVRGAINGFFLEQAGCNHNIIASNYISGGGSRMSLGTLCHDNQILNNELTSDQYGFDNPGAWSTASYSSAFYINRLNLYLISKFILTDNADTFDGGIDIVNAGSNNVVAGNHIFKAAGECVLLTADGVTYHTSHTTICSNTLENSSDVGVLVSTGNDDTRIFQNIISDCNINIRCHHMDYHDTNRLVYIYRNTSWLTNGVGEHIYFHYGNGTPDTYFPTFWFYHNSFSGGKCWLDVSSYAAGSGGITNCHFLNNIASDAQYLDGESFGGANYGFWTNSAMVGNFDYNLVTPPYPTYPTTNTPAWFGTNNIMANQLVWVNASNMSFQLPAGSAAINAAFDVTQPFTIGGTTYPALPVTGEIRVGSAWDIGAMEYEPPIILTGAAKLPNGAFQFAFTNTPAVTNYIATNIATTIITNWSTRGPPRITGYTTNIITTVTTNTSENTVTVLTTTNLLLPLTNWTVLGTLTDSPPGQFQFSDPQAANRPMRFYRVRSP